METLGISSKIGISGISMSAYDGGCERCKWAEGKIFPYLPSFIESLELNFHGFLCRGCEEILSNSKNDRINFNSSLMAEKSTIN